MLIHVILPFAFSLFFLLHVSDSNIGDYRRAAVSCANNYIRIELNMKFFNLSKYESITLRKNACKAVSSNNTILLVSTKKGCGTTKTETTEEIAFDNDVILRVNMSRSNITLHDHDQIISIRCVYKRGQSTGVSSVAVVDSNMTKGIVGSIEGFGSFTFTLAMYKDKTYKHCYHAYPVRVKLRDHLFFQASAIAKDSNLTLFIDQCYSTPTVNKTHHKKYVIIEDGCARDITVEFHQGDSHHQRFSMDSFRYVDHNFQIVYIHCKLILCHGLSKDGKCHSACFRNSVTSAANQRQMSSTSEKSINVTSSIHEIELKLKNESIESMNLGGNTAVVSCNSNYILVELNMKAFDISRYVSVTFRDNRCKAFVSKDRISLASTPNGCGASIKETAEEIIFENVVILKAKLSRHPVALHRHEQSILVRCVYKRSEAITLSFDPMPVIHPVPTGFSVPTGFGTFTLTLDMYKSKAYLNRHHAFPIKVNAADRLFFQVKVAIPSANSSDSITYLVDSCYLTPGLNTGYINKAVIIKYCCPVDDTVQFYKGDIHYQRFSIDVGRCRDELSSTVYMQCFVAMYLQSSIVGKFHSESSYDNLNCEENGLYHNSTSEDSFSTPRYLLTIGPIDINRKCCSISSAQKMALETKFILLISCIAALTLFTLA